jgi:phage gpG-like protein
MKVDLTDFVRKIDALNKSIKGLPAQVGSIAEKFSKERFRERSWLDKTKENWQPRKRERRSQNGNKTKNQTLLVQSGRLKKSIRKIKITNDYVIIGSDVPYAKIQNEGGKITATVNVKSFERKRQGRTEVVKAHTRKMNTTIPARKFMGESYTLTKRIQLYVSAQLLKALKA